MSRSIPDHKIFMSRIDKPRHAVGMEVPPRPGAWLDGVVTTIPWHTHRSPSATTVEISTPITPAGCHAHTRHAPGKSPAGCSTRGLHPTFSRGSCRLGGTVVRPNFTLPARCGRCNLSPRFLRCRSLAIAYGSGLGSDSGLLLVAAGETSSVPLATYCIAA